MQDRFFSITDYIVRVERGLLPARFVPLQASGQECRSTHAGSTGFYFRSIQSVSELGQDFLRLI